MEIGINWNSYGKMDIVTQARLIAENGFNSTFVHSKDPELKEVISVLKNHNIKCENAHAPFRSIADLWKEGADGEKTFAELTECVEKCAAYEIPLMVVHSSGCGAPEMNDIAYERFSRLMEYAKQEGIAVAYENLGLSPNLAFVMEKFPEAKFCWDVGHEECFTLGKRHMPLFGDRLGALHIQDNEMENHKDLHMIPFDGKINFDHVAKQLAESNYNGSIMLEVLRDHTHYYDNWSAEEYINHAAKAAARLRDAVENYRMQHE